MEKIALDLDAKDHDTDTCNLNANYYGVELRVQKIKKSSKGLNVTIFQKNC